MFGLLPNERSTARTRPLTAVVPGLVTAGDWAEALELLDRISSNNPRAAGAYYNKACDKQIRGHQREPAADALKDLQQAVELEPGLKQRAVSDPDFAAIKDAESFKALVH